MFRKAWVAAVAAAVLAGAMLVPLDASAAVVTGRAIAWGNNEEGGLGTGNRTPSATPVTADTSGPLHGLTLTAVSAGAGHTCAIADGKAYCWGYNPYGAVGNGSTDSALTPVPVDASGWLGGKTLTAISAGEFHTCAVADGKAYCWGNNYFGELGTGNYVEAHVPVPVDANAALAGRTVTAISAGEFHTCAVADGKAYCWGLNDHGQLGVGNTSSQLVPVAVDTSGWLSGKTVTAISAGMDHTCAVADGKAFCWGLNDDGELGEGTFTQRLAPVAVDTSGWLNGKTVSAITTGQGTRVRLPRGRRTAGAGMRKDSWGYGSVRMLRCRSR